MTDVIAMVLTVLLAVPLAALSAVLTYLLAVGASGIWWALKGND